MATDYFSNPPPDLDLTESRTASNNAIGIVLFVLSAIAVAARLLTRLRYQNAALGLDDWLMFVGLALNAGNLACCLAGGVYGLGKHIYTLGPQQMSTISVITFAFVFIYAWSVCIIKFSILALYRRIFGMTWLGWWCVFLTSGYLITNHIVLPLYCNPLSYYWTQWYEGSQGVVRINEAKFYLGVGIINLFGDICILSVPVASVWKLQMRKTQKIAVCFIFLLGSFVCFASLYRIVTIIHLTETTDISWAKSGVFIWSSVEPSVGIISGCLPTLHPLLLHMLDKFGYDPTSQKSSENNNSHTLNPLETISKKSTRKLWKRDILVETQFSHLGDENEAEQGTHFDRSKRQTQAWRPDEDEMSLTTTTIEARDRQRHNNHDGSSLGSIHEGKIVMTKEFEWGDSTPAAGR
ncbi:Uu.00g121330.m01.CDS01 [Anthostomella pinea]|uniref:Uu.00g121330.m01.CDS01 n=1 Tax=Anthostomella pinea TaxID=933095 RepID=A0AAI8YHA4_9PEZI|nr:Uu.00g121330.m01.CDS01 [Anthostomella pinea]